jgi:hypothetical protein
MICYSKNYKDNCMVQIFMDIQVNCDPFGFKTKIVFWNI